MLSNILFLVLCVLLLGSMNAMFFIQGLQFVLTFYCFFEKKKWISDHTKKECMKWIKILINSVDFCNDPSVQQCIEFFTDERSKIWQNFSAPISQKVSCTS